MKWHFQDAINMVFGTGLGQWTWIGNGDWPAISLGDAYPFDDPATTGAEISPADQPTSEGPYTRPS